MARIATLFCLALSLNYVLGIILHANIYMSTDKNCMQKVYSFKEVVVNECKDTVIHKEMVS